MFDLAWSEIAVIVVVAVVVIGPKDLPDTIRTVAKGIGKLRRMAGQLQGHLDEVVREAKLEDVRDQIRDIRNFDIKGEIQRTVDADGSLKKTFQEDPFRDDPFRAQPTVPSADAAPSTPAVPVGEGVETTVVGTPASTGADVAAVDREAPLATEHPVSPAPEGGRPAMGLDPLAPSAALPVPQVTASATPAVPTPEHRVVETSAHTAVSREELPRPDAMSPSVAPAGPVPAAPLPTHAVSRDTAGPASRDPAEAGSRDPVTAPPRDSVTASPRDPVTTPPRDPVTTPPRDTVTTPNDARNA